MLLWALMLKQKRWGGRCPCHWKEKGLKWEVHDVKVALVFVQPPERAVRRLGDKYETLSGTLLFVASSTACGNQLGSSPCAMAAEVAVSIGGRHLLPELLRSVTT